MCVCVSPCVERQCAEAIKRDFGEVCVVCVCVCYTLSSECVSSRAQKPFRGTWHECVSCVCANVFCTLSTESVSSHAQKPSKGTLAMVCCVCLCVCVRVFYSVEC